MDDTSAAWEKFRDVPRWVERRGFTLTRKDEGGDEGFVRVSLMERVGFVGGWFNVREARAQPQTRSSGTNPTPSVRVLGGGRALSWRWLREPEADRLLDERLGTLEAMGYALVDSGLATRGRWDWLYDLVNRRLDRAASEPEDPRDDRPTAALRDALCNLGLKPSAVLEGVAAVLGVPQDALTDPTPEVVHDTDPEELAVLLPFLLHHERIEVRSVGERWLRAPTVAYQLPTQTLMQWLESDQRVGELVGSRLDVEGLALLGPDRLTRLSRTGTPTVRDSAKHWMRRLG